MIGRALLAALALALGGCAARAPAPPPASVAEAPAAARPGAASGDVLILVSIDGVRPDYLGRGVTPTLSKLAAGGAATTLRPVFPSVTFPNHYSLVTGLHPDSHGIVANRMADPARPGIVFTLGSAQSFDPFWWDGAEPVWVTAERQGVRTATMFWPGSEVAIRGARPSAWQRYDSAVSNAQRVDQVIDWMRRPAATRPRLVTLYFEAVDTAGHRFGPDAPETTRALAEVDRELGRLVAELDALKVRANLVIVSDHGMAATPAGQVVALDRLVDPALVETVTTGPVAALAPRPGQEAAVAAQLARPHANASCWPRERIPARLRYGSHPRIPAFLCLAEVGWMIEPPGRVPDVKGMHGYDNAHPDMAAIFIAHGPAFAPGARPAPASATDLYPLVTRLLGIVPQPHEGDAQALAAALRAR